MISWSLLASPGASAPLKCHCSQRLELTIEPSSSAKQVDGRRKTSVWILAGSAGLDSPWFCQKLDVSVAIGSMITMYLSLLNASRTLLASGKEASGLKPCTIKPFILPWCISSTMCSTS